MHPRDIIHRIEDERSLLETHDPAKLESIAWLNHLATLIEGVDIRDVIVCDIASQIGADVIETERCAKCRAWKIEVRGQDFRDCWLCRTERAQLDRAQALLNRLRPKQVSHYGPWENEGWPEGMPL